MPVRAMFSLGMLGVLLCVAVIATHQLGRARRWQLFGRLIADGHPRDSVVALTFDDGPNALFTQWALDTLRVHNAKATFFLTGVELSRSMASAPALLSAGHELANHTWTHRRMAFVPLDTIVSEVERADSLLRRVGQPDPIYFRPPYGYKLIGLPWYLRHTGRTTIMWSIEPDSYDLTGPQMVRHVLDRVRPGSIILFHIWYPSRESSRAAVGPLIDSLHARGYQVTTAGEMLKH